MSSIATFIAIAFWAWTIYDCARHESDKVSWGLILLLFNLLGAAIYFVIRWLPRSSPFVYRLMNRGKQQRDLQRAIADVRSIGKAYQYIKLGDIYRDMNDRGHALAAYHQALAKEPDNTQALWGVATIEIKSNHYQRAADCLHKLMSLKPDHKFGDASLAYCQALYKLGDFNAAEHQLDNHIRCWSHPEAFLIMAQIKVHQQNAPGARELLATMIANVSSSPAFHYRKHQHHIKQGQRLLKSLSY